MTVVRDGTLAPEPAEGYRGTFAAADPLLAIGDALPVAWEGVYFPFAVSLADLRPDGTPARDGVLPQIDLPRRMYAGEDTEYPGTLRLGDAVVQTISPGAVTEKTGSSGRLVFADVVRTYAVAGRERVRSTWHDVFLDVADPDAPPPPSRRDPDPGRFDWSDRVVLDARQLFRFSALTFNTHLVHYDRTWAREREGLPDLLVHGPLLRILMADAARRRHPHRSAQSLSIRLVAPAFVDRPLRLLGREEGAFTRVSALDADDAVLATAELRWH